MSEFTLLPELFPSEAEFILSFPVDELLFPPLLLGLFVLVILFPPVGAAEPEGACVLLLSGVFVTEGMILDTGGVVTEGVILEIGGVVITGISVTLLGVAVISIIGIVGVGVHLRLVLPSYCYPVSVSYLP